MMATAGGTLPAMQGQLNLTGTVKVCGAEDGTIDVAIPGTAYRIRLDGSGVVGERTEGCIQATALKVHVASVNGEPRIVAGHVVALDADGAVVRSVVPVRICFEDAASAESIAVGDLVNFHVRSGAAWATISD